jgi:uncharacterized protein (TIGR01244 family)
MQFRKQGTLLLLFLAVYFQPPGFPEEENSEIPNLRQPRRGIYTSGQPSEAGMKELSVHGIKTIINLRAHDEEGARDESAESARLGMEYFYCPIVLQECTSAKMKEDALRLAVVLKDEGRLPVLIHCASANRVGALWAAYRVLHENAALEDALREGRDIGMKPVLEERVLSMLQDAKTGPDNQEKDSPPASEKR